MGEPLWQMIQPLMMESNGKCYAIMWQMERPQLHKGKLF